MTRDELQDMLKKIQAPRWVCITIDRVAQDRDEARKVADEMRHTFDIPQPFPWEPHFKTHDE